MTFTKINITKKWTRSEKVTLDDKKKKNDQLATLHVVPVCAATNTPVAAFQLIELFDSVGKRKKKNKINVTLLTLVLDVQRVSRVQITGWQRVHTTDNTRIPGRPVREREITPEKTSVTTKTTDRSIRPRSSAPTVRAGFFCRSVSAGFIVVLLSDTGTQLGFFFLFRRESK